MEGPSPAVCDNAASGLRGLRATPSPDLVRILWDCYGIKSQSPPLDLGGSSSLNLLIVDGDIQYVMRVYRPYVSEERLGGIHHIRRALRAQGIPCPQVIQTQEGDSWVALGERMVEVEQHIAHDGRMNTWERLEIALPLLGRIHAILSDIAVGRAAKKPLFANHVEPYDALQRTRCGARRIRAWHPTASEQEIADTAEELAQRVSDAERDSAPALPRQLVHGDFWDNNVFFRDSRVVAVTDLDFMGERARIDDLALTLYFAAMEHPEAIVSDDTLIWLGRLVAAYDSGLAEPLSRLERMALPLAIARQPLWSVGGWVALLDDEQAARRHAASMGNEIIWALRILDDLDRWQTAFT